MTEEGLTLLKRFEGKRNRAYKAVTTEKYYTIGYGHYGSDVDKDAFWTDDLCEQVLRNDVSKFEQQVKLLIGTTLNTTLPEKAVDALTIFAYNIGTGAFSKSTLLKVIKTDKNNMTDIEKQWMRWNKSGGKELAGLTKRRKAEFKMYKDAVLSAYTKSEAYDLGVQHKCNYK